MWLLGRCGADSFKIGLPPGAYLVPRYYDVGQLAALARLIADAAPRVGGALVMSWKQADVLEALGRIRGDGHRADALWAIHGEAGAPLPSGGELRSLVGARFPVLRPQWVLILDPEAPYASRGWIDAHLKMPLVSWLGRLLGDEKHPLHAAAVGGLDVQEMARMTSDPLEMIEVIEDTVAHRLTHALPAGVGSTGPVNVERGDWARSLRVVAARRLAQRVNDLPEAIRGDAARLLLGLDLAAERREPSLEALVRAGLLVPPSPSSDGRLALARTVLSDEEGRIGFQDALELPSDELKAMPRAAPRLHAGVESVTSTASVGASKEKIAPEDLPTELAARRQAAGAKGASAGALASYAEALDAAKIDPAQAAAIYERVIAADPKNADGLGSYAVFLEERRELDRAQEMYERAIAADPKHANNLGNYASFLRNERRELDRAQEMYERAIAADPKHANNLGNYASFLRNERRDLDRAQEMYERAIAADPKHANILGNYALFLRHERRELDGAQEMYERAIAAAPKHANNLGNYGVFLRLERRDLDRAQEMYERAIAADPKHALHLGNYANLLRHDRRDLDRAQEMYERAIAADPKNANNLGNYANFLRYERRDLDRAQEMYERAITADPKHANNLGNYANFLRHERRDLERAQEMYERAIAADPKHANNLGNYAIFLHNECRELERAQEMYERAIAADPKHAEQPGQLRAPSLHHGTADRRHRTAPRGASTSRRRPRAGPVGARLRARVLPRRPPPGRTRRRPPHPSHPDRPGRRVSRLGLPRPRRPRREGRRP